MKRRRRIARLVVALLALVTSSIAVAEMAPAPAEAAYYWQTLGNCGGSFSNWRGDYTTGYAWFGKSYSSDSDCKSATVSMYNNGNYQAGAADSSLVYSAVASSAYATHSAHVLCKPATSPPYYEVCNTQHWLNV